MCGGAIQSLGCKSCKISFMEHAAPPRPVQKGGTRLDGGGAPLDEVGQLALADALQALVHLRRVHLALRAHARTCRQPEVLHA